MKLLLISLVILQCGHLIAQVAFAWKDTINADFSFTENWDYPEGVYLNEWNQLSCDGLCPPEIERMKDENGRIFDDSLTAFYSYIDTTHRHFTHEGIVRAHEYGDCNYADVEKRDKKLYVYTEMNVGTHSSVQIEFFPDPGSKIPFKAYLIYNSIGSSNGPISYAATGGTIEISSKALRNGILQMRFDLEFPYFSDSSDVRQTWKGKILVALPD